jgi:integrase
MVKTQGEPTNRRISTAKPTKSIVRVGTDKGWLRLRWTYQGRRYALTLGLPDSAANRLYAEQKAKVVELDIISGNFDLRQ